MRYLLERPHTYITLWSFMFANSNEEGVFCDNYQNLLSRFKLSRSSLQRIIEYGCSFTSIGGQKMGRKWAANLNQAPLNEKLEESVKKKGRPKKEPNELYGHMVEVYDGFCHGRIGMGAKMDALQGKSMKSIISYLQSQVVKKQGDLSEVELNKETLNAWKFILSKWETINDFYGQQIKLNQINSNIPNILTQIRNSKNKNRNEKFANTVNQIDGISFE